jgi:hypothetical protein
MKTKFKPGTYIVTKEGHRGYIVELIKHTRLYQIRLASGCTVRSEQELEVDEISENID